MSHRVRILAIAWLCIAVLLRLYGAHGGDNAIVGGLMFLAWTAPFGMIWQFYLYNFAIAWLPVAVAKIIGDVIVIMVAVAFWFLFVPRIAVYIRRRKVSRSD